jgi:hypothetical protein
MDKSKEVYEAVFPDFINSESTYIVWQEAWKASREQAIKECREKIRKLREQND